MNTSLRTSLLPALALSLAVGPAAHADLVAKYTLDGNADDSSGNGFHGVVNGATFVGDADRGMVASFDGVAGSINVAASGYSITERPNFQFALTFWFKPEMRDDYEPGGVHDTNPILGATGSGVIELVGHGAWQGMGGVNAYGGVGVNSGGGAGSVARIAEIDLYDGEWHHVAIQWEDPDGVPSDVTLGGSTDATIWIDNQLAMDANPAQTYNGNSNQANPAMVLGGPVVFSNGGPANKFYKGLLSDVRFFDTQLTTEEVDAIYQDGLGVADPLGLAITASGDDLVFTWNSTANRAYTLRGSTALDSEPLTWTPVAGDLEATPPLNTLTIPRPADPQTFYVIEQHSLPPVFFDDFETDLGWTTGSEGAAGTMWERGTPTAVGPLAASSPVNCYGTNLASLYDYDANVWLRSPAIDLTDPALTGASLRFFQFRDLEAGFDFGSLLVLNASDNSPLGAAVLSNLDGSSIDWEEVTATLPPEALGNSILLEFRFTSDPDTNFENLAGWYIDDVEVSVQ
jgi:hypothetical protein